MPAPSRHVLLALTVLACSTEAPQPTDPPSQTSSPIGPMCQAGCVETDPHPEAPGTFLGSSVTPWACAQDTDHDLDGLSTFCEKNLALAFAPLMRWAHGDNVDHEGYWAARPLPDDRVRIFYLLGYYVDLGVVDRDYENCKLSTLGEVLAECDGHHGDSEHVILDVYYDEGTSHWLLEHAQLSRHGDYNVIDRGNKAYPSAFQYSARVGVDPIIWVAQQKHANYPNQSLCDAGSQVPVIGFLFPFDHCGGANYFFRAEAAGNRNIGSNSMRLIDCVQSQSVFLKDNPAECLWSRSTFTGWQLDHTTSSEGYGSQLRSKGF